MSEIATATPPERRRGLAIFALVNAIVAWAGAAALVVGLSDFGERVNARLPFDSPVLAGLALAVVVAAPLSVLAWSAATGGRRTDDVALIVGVLLIGWIVVQIVVLRALSPFHVVYVCIGAGFVAASRRLHVGRRTGGLLLISAGAIGVAIGVGLVPHLIKGGLTVMSAVSVGLLAVGLVVVIVGARSTLHDHGRLGMLAGGAGIVALTAVIVWLVAPAVAATNVPATTVSDTPESVGLDYQSVALATADGVQLGGWYVAGANGAGVVVLHGAGSTRSGVLDQAAALNEAGYAVLLLDARGHGDSDGTAMDFGWYGDLDIAAGTAYLASQPDVDRDRIGVVGFSMGGEEAIGAAARDPLISAVVAEGATGRQAADKAWLSDVYGWRGWLQEQFEKVQYGITDLLTDASPPTALRNAVVAAVDTEFFLITAGNVADEGHAAAYIQSGSKGRARVWNVDGAGHTGGYDAGPEEWRDAVIGFLDESLG